MSNATSAATVRAATRTITKRRCAGRSRYDISVATASAESAMAAAISHARMDSRLLAAETIPTPMARSRPPTARREAFVAGSWAAVPSHMRPARSGKKRSARPMETRTPPNQARALRSIDVPRALGQRRRNRLVTPAPLPKSDQLIADPVAEVLVYEPQVLVEVVFGVSNLDGGPLQHITIGGE